jgi:hypothetical protein
MGNKDTNKKAAFIILSGLGIGCLFGAFAGNLQPYKIYSQTSEGLLGKSSKVYFVLPNNPIPRGLDISKSQLLAEELNDYSSQKMILLGGAIASSSLALICSSIDFESLEVDQELKATEVAARKQLKGEQIKHKYALMSHAQRELFRSELEALLAISGGDDSEYQAGEALAADKYLNCQYMVQEGHPIDAAVSATWGMQPGTREHSVAKLQFEAWQRGDDPSQAVNLSQYEEDERGSGRQ